MSTFKFAGVSKLNGKFKVRFSDRAEYVKCLAVAENTDIDIIELKEPMTKEGAVAFLLSIDFDNGNAEIRQALESDLERREIKAGNRDKPGKEAKKPKKEKTAPAKKISLEDIAARGTRDAGTPETIADLTATFNSMIKPKSTLTRAEILAQLSEIDELDDAPF
jgi:hypothetical protein